MAKPEPAGPSSAHTLDPEETAELLRGEPDRSDTGADSLVRDLEFLYDVPLQVSVEVGRARILLKDLLQMGEGSVVELDKMAGEPFNVPGTTNILRIAPCDERLIYRTDPE